MDLPNSVNSLSLWFDQVHKWLIPIIDIIVQLLYHICSQDIY